MTALKILNFTTEWMAADYVVFITLLTTALLCGVGHLAYVMKNEEKYSNRCNILASVTFVVGLLCSFTLFCVEPDAREEFYSDMHLFLDLSFLNQISLVVILLSLLVGYHLFKKVRDWVITNYNITMYYLIIIGVRAGFLFHKVDLQLFLSVEGGLILFALIWVFVFCKTKPGSILEWGKQVVKVLFCLQLTLMGAYFLAVVLCQPTPCLWVYTNVTFFLFEAALCLGQVLVEMTAADGILWGDFTARVGKIRRLVYPDYAPAFQGGEESAQEKQPEAQLPNANACPMIQAPTNQGQGGLPFGGGPQGVPLVPGENPGVIIPLEGEGRRFPLSGILPSGIIVQSEILSGVLPDSFYQKFPAETLPRRDIGFRPGIRISDLEDTPTPNTLNGDPVSGDSFAAKKRQFFEMKHRNRALEFCYQNPDQMYLGQVVEMNNVSFTKGGVYVQAKSYGRFNLPKYHGGSHVEMFNGILYNWIPLTMEEFIQHAKNQGCWTNDLQLSGKKVPFICHGQVVYRVVEQPLEKLTTPAIIYNGTRYYMQSPQPAMNLPKQLPALPVGAADQATGVEPQPDKGAAGSSVEGQPQPEPEQLSALPVAAADQASGVEPHPDQGAAKGSVAAQPHQEPLAAGPAAAQGQVVGVGPQPDQGRAGVGGDGQCDQPTPPANRGATPRAEVSDAAHTFRRGRGGGPGPFRGVPRGGFRAVNSPLGSLGHHGNGAPFAAGHFVPGHGVPFPAGHFVPGHGASFTGQWSFVPVPGGYCLVYHR